MPTTTEDRFRIGDRVLHPGKPEWGAGTVASAAGAVHEGAPCQRLSIRFDRAGLKTISTAFVSLRRAAGLSAAMAEAKPAPAVPAGASNGPVGTTVTGAFSARSVSSEPDPFGPGPSDGLPADPRELRRWMTRIPEDAVDPFRTPAARLRAVLSLYRFEPTPGSLIDWAAAQSGFSDPLSRFSRQELEEYFGDFRRNLDRALSKAVADAGQVEASELRTIAQSAPALGQRALQALHRRR